MRKWIWYHHQLHQFLVRTTFSYRCCFIHFLYHELMFMLLVILLKRILKPLALRLFLFLGYTRTLNDHRQIKIVLSDNSFLLQVIWICIIRKLNKQHSLSHKTAATFSIDSGVQFCCSLRTVICTSLQFEICMGITVNYQNFISFQYKLWNISFSLEYN